MNDIDARIYLARLREQLVEKGYTVDPVEVHPMYGASLTIHPDGSEERVVWCESYDDYPHYRWEPSILDPLGPVSDVAGAVRTISAYLGAAREDAHG